MENFTLIDFHQARDFSRKMNVTFEFVRQNFKSLAKSILMIAGPPVIVASLFLGSFMNDFMALTMNAGRGGDPKLIQDMFMSVNFWSQMGLMMLFMALSMVATIATLNNYLILYEQQQTNKIPVAMVWEKVRGTLSMYFGTIFLYVLAIVLAYLVLGAISAISASVLGGFSVLVIMAGGVAAVYFTIAASLVFIIRGYEGIGFFEAMSRSFSLIHGKWWSTFGLVFILSLIGGVISYIFMIPWYALTIISAVHNVSGESIEPSSSTTSVLAMVFFSLYYMAQMLLQSLPNLGIAFQYFNLVERKEARGLLSEIETIGQAPVRNADQDEHY